MLWWHGWMSFAWGRIHPGPGLLLLLLLAGEASQRLAEAGDPRITLSDSLSGFTRAVTEEGLAELIR